MDTTQVKTTKRTTKQKAKLEAKAAKRAMQNEKRAANRALEREAKEHALQKARAAEEDIRISNIFKSKPNNYNIKKIFETKTKTFQKIPTTRSHWKVYGDVDISRVHVVMQDLINKMTAQASDNAKLQIALENNKNGKVIQTVLLNKTDIIDKVSDWVSWFTDYHDMDINDITFKLLKIEIPVGAGRRVNKIITADNKRSIIQIRNRDTLCLARSIVVGLVSKERQHLESILKGKLTDSELKQINRNRRIESQINEGIISDGEKLSIVKGYNLQGILARVLHRLCKIPVKENGNNFEDVQKFERKLDIGIQVYDFEVRQIYKDATENPIKVYLLMDENHYNVISNISGFTCANESHHKARDMKCKACSNKTKCDTEEDLILCKECGKSFYGKQCLDNHVANKKCIEHSYVCKECHKYYKTSDVKPEYHKCGEIKCGNCKLYVDKSHQCYMLQKEIKPYSEKYVFFDFEAKLVSNKHIVNYCIAHDFDGKENIFHTIDEFCSWAFSPSHKGYTFIAHYGKGYDFQFIVEWLIAHGGVKPKIIHNGQKIMQLEVMNGHNIRFIDSISFIPMPLRKFPKTFGLTEIAKGYFPHKFNTDENQEYNGPYPDRAFYVYDEMKKEDREQFDDWYKTTEGKTFDFKQEMYKYCKSDVDILRRGCIELRQLFIEIAKIDPFRYITIASVCQAIYRSQFLPKDTIGIVDEAPVDTYSIKSIKWLKYMSQTEGVNIKHACNGGETTIAIDGKSYKVDGYCEETKTTYQFHGCYWHGCKTCYDGRTINRFNQCKMEHLRDRTESIDFDLILAGYNPKSIWEHEFDSDPEMKNIQLDEYDLVEPVKARDGFFGGRTEPFKLIYDFKSKADVRGKYIDVVSLYPTVMYYDKFPIGHPEKIVKPEKYDNNWFGFIHCKVIPPRWLYLPVLPYKQKTKQSQKLLFGLCRTCMERIDAKCTHFNTTKCNIKCDKTCKVKGCQQCKIARKLAKQNCQQCYASRNADCTHSDSERAIRGFWTTVMMDKALKKGYRIDKIYEVWHFEQTSTDLFKEYVRKFLKIKLETSEFTCSEEEYRQKARKFEIELGELKKNPGLRFIAKLCLNSLWGKFGQNPKVRHSEYINNERDFYRVILNDKVEQISLSFLNDDMVYASYETKDEFLKVSYNTNVYIACFTTSWAQLRLYDMMDKLDRNVCYCDTDSVVYIENEKTKEIVDDYIGDGLGEWTDELGGASMDLWCCAQAKDYGYILDNGKHAGKVKGFKVNAETEEKMTNEQRVKLIKGAINTVDINYNRFDIKNCEIITKHMAKQWAFKYDKRMITG